MLVEVIEVYGMAVAIFCFYVTWSVVGLKGLRALLSFHVFSSEDSPLLKSTVVKIVGLLSVLTLALVFITNDPFQLIYSPEKKNPDTPRSYYYNMHLVKEDISDPERVFDIEMRLASQAFSAQLPIIVHELRIQQLSGSNFTDTLIVIFPRANLIEDRQSEDNPSVFQYFQGAALRVATPDESYYRNNDQWGGWEIRYDIQGCYNIVITTNSTAVKGRNLFVPDCTEVNIASLEATRSLELAQQNIDIQNLVIKQNNTNLKIGLYVLLITVFGIPLGFIVSYYFQKTIGTQPTQPPK